MRVHEISKIWYLKSDESLNSFDFNRFKIISSPHQLEREIFNLDFNIAIGNFEIEEIAKRPFILGLFEADSYEEAKIMGVNDRYLMRLLFNLLWFSKDHAVNLGNWYVDCPDQRKTSIMGHSGFYSNSEGGYAETLITKDDFEIAKNAFEKFESFITGRETEKPDEIFTGKATIIIPPINFRDYNQSNRLQRALTFLSLARANSFLPLKIALFMSLLETLFTTDKMEVVHKVCQRTALYIGETYEERVKIYSDIGKAYQTRSDFFHGQIIEKKQGVRSKLQYISTNVDGIVRRSLIELFLKTTTYLYLQTLFSPNS